MFVTLLAATFCIALATSFLVARLFDKAILTILTRIVGEELGPVWHRYIKFALYVVGVSGGVRIWELEKYITPRDNDSVLVVLNRDRWTLEVYRTVIGSLQSVAMMLLAVFLVALVAYVVLRGFEIRRGSGNPERKSVE